MLTSITPLGERGRGQRWGVTASFLVVGHLVGGLILGGLLAGAGTIVRAAVGAPTDAVSLVIVGSVALVALAADMAGGQLPGSRQVDELWLNQYRGWVYGFGFGLQLGMGLVTVVNTMLFPAFLLAATFVSASTAFGLGVGYAAIRAAMSVLSAGVATVEDLKALHRRIDRADRQVRLGEAIGVGLVAIGAAAVGSVI